jgi:hypothetical protein
VFQFDILTIKDADKRVNETGNGKKLRRRVRTRHEEDERNLLSDIEGTNPFDVRVVMLQLLKKLSSVSEIKMVSKSCIVILHE